MQDARKLISELEETLDFLEPGQMEPQTEFRNIPGWDSLATLTLLATFDSVFQKQLNAADLATCQTIQDVVDLA